MKYAYIIALLVSSLQVNAMEELQDSGLTSVTGQAGADISLKMQLNHTPNSTFACDNLVYCRFAISVNNRYHDGTQDTFDANGNRVASASGRQQWVVFKGIQGTINIPKIMLDATDINFTNVSNGTELKAALNLGVSATNPIQIRNLGFQSMAIETDTSTNSNTNNIPGYLIPLDATGAKYTVAGFDNNKEKGFLGVNMNSNIALNGNLKIFSCASGTHLRC